MTREEQITHIAGSIADGCIAHGAPWKEYYKGFTEGAKWADANPSRPSLPSNLDEAAEGYAWKKEEPLADGERLSTCFNPRIDAFKAGAEWYYNQMKMPNSSELISAWRGVKSILQEKDFRGDEWRLAYNAFMFGFSRGLNTQKKEK